MLVLFFGIIKMRGVNRMSWKTKKGYSLIEIGVGVLILTVFLVCSIALFNGCYNTYRMIQQRNIAVDYAVANMEKMLQTDADILTGFFVESYDASSNQSILKANETFRDYVEDNFELEFKQRYANLYRIDVGNVGTLNDKEYEAYIYKDRDYLIASYIQNYVENLSEADFNSEEVQKGNYALFVPSVVEEGSLTLPTNSNNMIIRKTITRLPITELQEAFGNQVLKIKVEVLYTGRINNRGATEDDLKSITLESVKVASASN